MNQEQITAIKKNIALMSLYYGRQLPDEVLQLYVDDLKDLPFDQLNVAFRRYRMDPRNRAMFIPAHIRNLIKPEINNRDLAIETAARIQFAISRYGYSNAIEAREYIGEEGWRQIEKWGGWNYICQNVGAHIDLGHFMAQIRNSIETTLNLEASGIDTSMPSIEQARENFQIKNILSDMSKKMSIEGKVEKGGTL